MLQFIAALAFSSYTAKAKEHLLWLKEQGDINIFKSLYLCFP